MFSFRLRCTTHPLQPNRFSQLAAFFLYNHFAQLRCTIKSGYTHRCILAAIVHPPQQSVR